LSPVRIDIFDFTEKISEKNYKDEAYYKTILGFDTPKAMAEAFTSDYANMISSIKKYGGFYIGRYELSNEAWR